MNGRDMIWDAEQGEYVDPVTGISAADATAWTRYEDLDPAEQEYLDGYRGAWQAEQGDETRPDYT